MICPKCGFEQPDGQDACIRCGVIFAKVHFMAVSHGEEPGVCAGHEEARFGAMLKMVLTDIPQEENPVVRSGWMLVWLGLMVWGVKFMFMPISGEAFSESYMHLVNLPFHEAGHIIFSVFGRFVWGNCLFP